MASAVSEDNRPPGCGDNRIPADPPRTPHTLSPKFTERVELSPTLSPHENYPQESQTWSSGISNISRASHERSFGLPPIRPISPLSKPRPQHKRRHSFLRNEYHPSPPSEHNISYGATSNENALGLETWTSPPSRASGLPPSSMAETFGSTGPPSHFHSGSYMEPSVQKSHVNMDRFPIFTHDNGVSFEDYSPDLSFASPAQKTHIHSFDASPSALAIGNYNFSPVHYNPSHILPISRERSVSAPIATQFSPEPQLSMTSYENVNVNGVAPQTHKHGLSSPTLHSLTHPSPSITDTAPSPRSSTKKAAAILREPPVNEDECLKSLIEAMQDMTDTQDNPGILDTWRKLMKAKKLKIERICKEMMGCMIKVGKQNGEPLGEKRPVFVYQSFKDRFDAVCKALKTQKTMCKHLLEDPYMFQVIDDPIQALKRVQNNRRVNQQKKEAIEEGRKRLGVRGRGKGVALQLTLSPEGQTEVDDDELSTREPSSERENEYKVLSKNQRPRRAATKRYYTEISDEEDMDGSVEAPTSPKKTKRNTHNRSKSAIETSRASTQTPTLIGSSNDAFTPSSLPSHSYPYAPTAARHSTGSIFRPMHDLARSDHALPSYNNFNYPYNGLSTHRYGDMRPMYEGGTPASSPNSGTQIYQPSSSDTYSEVVTPEDLSPSEQKHFDPYIH